MRIIVTHENELLICEANAVSRDKEGHLMISCGDWSETIFTSIEKCSVKTFKDIIDRLLYEGVFDLRDHKFTSETSNNMNIVEDS